MTERLLCDLHDLWFIDFGISSGGTPHPTVCDAELIGMIKTIESRLTIRIIKEAEKHKLDDFDNEISWLCRCLVDAKS